MALTAAAESESKRGLIIGIVIAIHVGGFYLLESGLAKSIIEMVAPPVETKIIEEEKPPEEPPPPPPPPPDMPVTPPPFIPPPEVMVQTPPPVSTIQTVTTERPPDVIPPIMTPPAPPVSKDVIEQPSFSRNPPNLESFYPASAKREEREGSVIVSYTVQADGSITDIQVEESSGQADLDKGAIDYVKTWRMKPGKRNGVAQVMPQRKKVTFKMTKK
ncbi:MAG: energy transducer TonB [Steroidobacteraceae bacterium]